MRYRGEGECVSIMSRVQVAHSDDEFPVLLRAAGERLTVVDFSASW